MFTNLVHNNERQADLLIISDLFERIGDKFLPILSNLPKNSDRLALNFAMFVTELYAAKSTDMNCNSTTMVYFEYLYCLFFFSNLKCDYLLEPYLNFLFIVFDKIEKDKFNFLVEKGCVSKLGCWLLELIEKGKHKAYCFMIMTNITCLRDGEADKMFDDWKFFELVAKEIVTAEYCELLFQDLLQIMLNLLDDCDEFVVYFIKNEAMVNRLLDIMYEHRETRLFIMIFDIFNHIAQFYKESADIIFFFIEYYYIIDIVIPKIQDKNFKESYLMDIAFFIDTLINIGVTYDNDYKGDGINIFIDQIETSKEIDKGLNFIFDTKSKELCDVYQVLIDRIEKLRSK